MVQDRKKCVLTEPNYTTENTVQEEKNDEENLWSSSVCLFFLSWMVILLLYDYFSNIGNTLGGHYMRPVRTQTGTDSLHETGMNSGRYDNSTPFVRMLNS